MPGIVSTKRPQSMKETENMAREGVNANQVFASGFPETTNESDLYLFFGSYGEVTSVKLLINKKKNALAGAFITFRDCRCAELVLEDQKRRQMFFKGAKIHVREAYKDRQTGDFNRQGGGQEGQRGGYGSDRGNNYDRGYSTGGGDNNPFLQTQTYSTSSNSGMVSDNRSSNQYSNQGQSQGYAMDTRRDDGYNSANRRTDNYNQGYGNQGARQQEGYSDNYNRSQQSNYTRQENVSMDTSRRYEEPNRSMGYQDDFNRSSNRFDSSYNRDTSQTQSADSGSWADIMDREDRFGDRRVDNRSFDRSRDAGAVGNTSYNRDSGVNVRQDNYGNNYNRDNRAGGGYDNQRQGYDGGRSATNTGYNTQRTSTGYDSGRSGYDSYRSSDRPVQAADNFRSQPAANYAEPARYSTQSVDHTNRESGTSRSGNYVREQEVSSALNRSGNFGRAQERYDQRDSRKRGSEWVGGYEEVVPRKQMATPGRDDRPANFNVRNEATQNPFIQSLNNMDNKAAVPVQGRNASVARGPGATSTPRGFEARAGRGRNFNQRGENRSGFVGGPDRKDRTPARGARGGARRITARGGVISGPVARQPVNQGRAQINRNFGQSRPSDRHGWVGGGSADLSPNRPMAGNMSPPAGMNEGRFQGNLMQQQGMGMAQGQVLQQQQQLQQMQIVRQQQMNLQQQQQKGQMMGGGVPMGGGGMQGIMSTLAQLLQNLSKGRGPQQLQMQQNILRELNPLERDVVAEVKRSLNVEETPLFASAIIMMRPMDDEVIRIFTQLPQGILTKILRGAAPDVITEELAKIKNTKSYDNRAEARFHVLRKLLVVLYKVSREQMVAMPFGPVKPVMQLRRPVDISRQRLMLAKRRLNIRGGRGGVATKSVRSTDKTESKKDNKPKEVTKEAEKVEEKKQEKKEGVVSMRGRGSFRRGFDVRGRGGFRGRGIVRGGMRGRGPFRGRGNFRGRGRGGAPKPNGEAKKPETKTTTPVAKKATTTTTTTATTPKVTKKVTTTNGAAKKAPTPTAATKKTPVTRKAVAKKTPQKTTPKTTPAKTTPGKAAATKPTPNKTPTKK